MEAVLYTVLAAALVIFSLVLHEAAHAAAMMKRGIRIKSAGIGIPVPYLTVTLHPKSLDFPVKVSPLLLGAYVEPDKSEAERLEALPLRDQAAISAAGIEANLAFGALLFLPILVWRIVSGSNTGILWVTLAVLLGLLAIMVFLRTFFRLVLVPLLGVLQLGFILTLIFSFPIASSGMVGPIGIAQMMYSNSLVVAISLAGFLSIAIGLTQMLPLAPFDGGRIITSLLPKGRTRTIYNLVAPIAALALIGYAILGDILRLFH